MEAAPAISPVPVDSPEDPTMVMAAFETASSLVITAGSHRKGKGQTTPHAAASTSAMPAVAIVRLTIDLTRRRCATILILLLVSLALVFGYVCKRLTCTS